MLVQSLRLLIMERMHPKTQSGIVILRLYVSESEEMYVILLDSNKHNYFLCFYLLFISHKQIGKEFRL